MVMKQMFGANLQYIGLLLNLNAVCPKKWKPRLIMCFLHRAKCICSKYELYLKEVQKLRLIFNKNGYSK